MHKNPIRVNILLFISNKEKSDFVIIELFDFYIHDTPGNFKLTLQKPIKKHGYEG